MYASLTVTHKDDHTHMHILHDSHRDIWNKKKVKN